MSGPTTGRRWKLPQWICAHLLKHGAKGGPFLATTEPRIRFNGMTLERAADGGWTFGLELNGKAVAEFHFEDQLYPGMKLTIVDDTLIGSVPLRVVG